ncbi:MAG: purine-binding chemotaxis protein CheW [Leptospiraceae bacterium]|nr:purine-binding chemotaxis protein CheW [Leptospiraceae bacterium]MCB1303624.1 purine-binding chemotaxis protein CheW [Leptospiraceae bacterium]
MTEITALSERGYYDADLDQEALIEKLQFLVFQSGNGMYGVNILETHEILKPVAVTRLPNVESEVLGVINLRGNIIPVIDILKKFSGDYAEITDSTRIVVCTWQEKNLGLLVDRVVEVASVAEEDIESPEVKGLSNQYLKGVGRSNERIFLIFNLAILFSKQTADTQDEEGLLEA